MRHRNSLKLYGIALALLLLLRPIDARTDNVSDLMTQQQQMTAKINSSRSTIGTLQTEINNLNTKIQNNQEAANEVARNLQVSNPTQSILTMILSTQSMSELIEQMMAINLITTTANQQLQKLKDTKVAKSKALDEQNAAQVQLDQEDQKLKDSLAIATPPASFTPQNSNYANLDVTEDQARANIVARESGGNYNAVNGRYYGAYQMDISRLSGDLSPANQDAVAQKYINDRYQGSWVIAWNFWINHHWY